MDYIIGGGAVGSIVKSFLPESQVVALGKSVSEIPVRYLWSTDFTKRYVSEILSLSDINYKLIINATELQNESYYEAYNRLTYKSPGSRPSSSRRAFLTISNDIKLKCDVGIESKVTNINIDNKTFRLEGGNDISYDRLFVCAPIENVWFHHNGQDFTYGVDYYPMQVYEFDSHDRCVFPPKGIDYIYTFTHKALSTGLFRVARHDDHTITCEVARCPNGDKELELTKNEVTHYLQSKGQNVSFIKTHSVRGAFVHRTSDAPKDVDGNLYFLGRFAQCDHEILLSDVIQKMFSLISQ